VTTDAARLGPDADRCPEEESSGGETLDVFGDVLLELVWIGLETIGEWFSAVWDSVAPA
jgi:hypothetical protein